jgi:hypothetical protein
MQVSVNKRLTPQELQAKSSVAAERHKEFGSIVAVASERSRR